MNEILANIYGTGGFDKTAAASEGLPQNLSDLSLMIISADHTEGDDLEKVASAHNQLLDSFVSFDRSGRALAHQEFLDMEKAASDGNAEALESFFEDVLSQEGNEEEETDVLRQAIIKELNRRKSN